MVRKDPMNERGPAPPGGDRGDPKAGIKEKRIKVPLTLFHLQPVEEYQKLWRNALIGCSSIIGLLEGYDGIGMPELPVEILEDFVQRLQTVIERHKPDVSNSSSETSLPE